MNTSVITTHGIPVLNGIFATLAALVSQSFSHAGFSPSQFLNVTHSEQLADYIRQQDPSFRFTGGLDHYDGAYFWAMAADPFAQGTAHTLIDLPGYRYGHPMWSWLASLLSLGNIAWLDAVFWLMTLGSMFAAGYLFTKVALAYGASPWAGLVVGVSPGLLFAATCSLTEPFQVALICGLLLLNRRPRLGTWGLAWLGVVSVMACLTKEQLVLCAAALVLVNLSTRDWDMVVRSGVILLGPCTLAAWMLVRAQLFSASELRYDSGNIGFPFSGWGYMVRVAQTMRNADMFRNQIASTLLPILAVLLLMIVLAIVKWAWSMSALSTFVMFQGFLITCMGWRTLAYPHETWRLTAVFVLFFVLVLLVPRRTLFSLPTPATV